MEILKFYLAALLCMGFIFLLINRTIKNNNYIRRSIFILISGGVITLIFCGGVLFDYLNNAYLYPNDKYDLSYFAFLIVSIFYTLLFFVIYFVKGRTRKQRFRQFKYNVKKSAPTIKDKIEYIYLIFKYHNNIILKYEIKDDNKVYSSLNIKFQHNIFFHDEMIKKIIESNNIDSTFYQLIGKATKKDKKDIVYYCYHVELNSINEFFKNYEEISMIDLVNYNLSDFDKKIIYTSIVHKEFNIEL